jgi:hypothetical protein
MPFRVFDFKSGITSVGMLETEMEPPEGVMALSTG